MIKIYQNTNLTKLIFLKYNRVCQNKLIILLSRNN